MNKTKEQTEKKIEIDPKTFLGKPYKVILFNDDYHDMYEVSFQIMKAIKCTTKQAASIMMEAHVTGQAVVFTGSKERCELVESILNQINLTTDIIPA